MIEFLYPTFFVAFNIVWAEIPPNFRSMVFHGLQSVVIGWPSTCSDFPNKSIRVSGIQEGNLETAKSIKLFWYFSVDLFSFKLRRLLFQNHQARQRNWFFNQQIYWTAIFAIGCAIFRDTRQVEKYLALLCALSIPIVLISFPESVEQHVLWMKKIPKILTIPDPSVKVILTPVFRAGTNFFRVRTTFSTPLEEAEYLSLLTPFLLYFGFSAKNLLFRVISIALIPAIFIAIRLTDCRLGIVGMLVSILLYGVLWSIVRWRAHPRDLIAAATVYLYPIVFVAALGVVFTSHRLRAMALGAMPRPGVRRLARTSFQWR